MDWLKETERLHVAPGWAAKRTHTNRWGVYRAYQTASGKLLFGSAWPIEVRPTLAEAKATAEVLAKAERPLADVALDKIAADYDDDGGPGRERPEWSDTHPGQV